MLARPRWRGRRGGRKRRMTPGKVESARRLLKGGMSPRDVAQNLGVSVPTLYRRMPASSRLTIISWMQSGHLSR